MPLNYKVATANCGNDILGIKAVKAIVQQLKRRQLDFFLINAQEIHFDNALNEISNNLPRGYSCKLLGEMPTHTKISEFQRNRTGLANIIIYKQKTVTVEDVSSMECRRKESSLSQGYNKGSLSSRLSLKSSGKKYKIETITGHLESYDAKTRITDWQKTFFNFHKKRFENFKQLAELIPDNLNIGMDANTRNLSTEQNKAINIWRDGGLFEAETLSKMSFGSSLYSKPSTYKTNKLNVDKKRDKKRAGRVKGGSLDVIEVINTSQPYDSSITHGLDTKSASEIVLEPEYSERDHHIILSPLQQLDPNHNEFKRCQNFIAQSLARFSPFVAHTIASLEENDQNKELLVAAYNSYLGTTKSLFGHYCNSQQQKLNYLKSQNLDEAIEQQQQKSSLINLKESLIRHETDAKKVLSLLFAIDEFIVKIEKLRYQFLSQAQYACEKVHINTLIEQSLNEINTANDVSELKDKLNTMYQAVNCMLEINADFYYYEKKISNNRRKQQDLIKIRTNLIDKNLNACYKLDVIQRSITSKETLDIFSTHEDRMFLFEIYRWIKSFFDDNANKTRGEKYLTKSSDTISHFFNINKKINAEHASDLTYNPRSSS